ncbi:hypothetical protein EVG20_g3649 [Dentipellis fragilis]|uniref:Uncharacterized protein n=1 Tax=Dentipellis fragilis TaxID=205917 RepID=A0A4Y9Z0N5_9AGAM|nr:hypothetical protein EVG20_g3649 [Dentipellis fragilis]
MGQMNPNRGEELATAAFNSCLAVSSIPKSLGTILIAHRPAFLCNAIQPRRPSRTLMPIVAFSFGVFGDICILISALCATIKTLRDSANAPAELEELFAEVNKLKCLTDMIKMQIPSLQRLGVDLHPSIMEVSSEARLFQEEISAANKLLETITHDTGPFKALSPEDGYIHNSTRNLRWQLFLRPRAVQWRKKLRRHQDNISRHILFLLFYSLDALSQFCWEQRTSPAGIEQTTQNFEQTMQNIPNTLRLSPPDTGCTELVGPLGQSIPIPLQWCVTWGGLDCSHKLYLLNSPPDEATSETSSEASFKTASEITFEASVDTAPDPTSEIIPRATPEPTSEITSEASFDAAPDPTPDPTSEGIPRATPEPTSEPTARKSGHNNIRALYTFLHAHSTSALLRWSMRQISDLGNSSTLSVTAYYSEIANIEGIATSKNGAKQIAASHALSALGHIYGP